MLLLLLACAPSDLELIVPEDPLSGEVEVSLTGSADQLLILVDGAVLGGGPGPGLTLTWDTSTVEPGGHVLRGQGFTGSQQPAETIVAVVVEGTVDQAPVVEFLEPLDQEVLSPGIVSVLLAVESETPLDTVRLVADGELLADLPVDGPWEADWELTLGEHELEATAWDLAGNVGSTSIEVSVVDAAMECLLTQPSEGTVPQGETQLRAAVTSAEGVVSSVRFVADEVVLYEDTEAPWVYAWDASGLDLGSQVLLEVQGLDDVGNSCLDSRLVTVVEDQPVELEVVITSPADGSMVSGADMPLQVAVQSEHGLKELACSAGGVLQGTLDEAPWNFTVDTTAFQNGPLVVEVVATELVTGELSSDSVELDVEN